jgi:antitoxin ParD1/3/4
MQQATEKLSITLPAEMARLIREKVKKGSYASNSEVIREAMRAWMERENRLTALDAAIAQGIADAEAGRVQNIVDVRQELQQRFKP